MTVSVMLDLETWGTEPGCDIRSIGAVVFNPVTGTIAGDIPHDRSEFFKNGMLHSGPSAPDNPYWFYVACDNPTVARNRYDGDPNTKPKYPLHRDPRTVQWWSEQSEAAQAAFADPVDLRVALERFSEWIAQLVGFNNWDEEFKPFDIRLWSHGAATDGPWLAVAYKAVGLPVPWHYRAPRDTRTAFDMAGITDHTAWLKEHPGPMGVAHHALDDAICQARAVCGAYEKNRNETVDADGRRWRALNAPDTFASEYTQQWSARGSI